MWETWVRFLDWEDPLEYWQLSPVFLPLNSMDRGAWWAAVHGVTKSQTRPSDFTFTFHFHALEKAMATHSSVLAWRIPLLGPYHFCPLSSPSLHEMLPWYL